MPPSGHNIELYASRSRGTYYVNIVNEVRLQRWFQVDRRDSWRKESDVADASHFLRAEENIYSRTEEIT